MESGDHEAVNSGETRIFDIEGHCKAHTQNYIWI